MDTPSRRMVSEYWQFDYTRNAATHKVSGRGVPVVTAGANCAKVGCTLAHKLFLREHTVLSPTTVSGIGLMITNVCSGRQVLVTSA